MVKENTVKKFLPILSLLCLFSLGSCTRKEPAHSPVTPPSENEVTFAEDFTVTSSVLVVYFSKTHTTENVALSIRELTDADLFQIERKEPYPEAYTPTTEVAQEEKQQRPTGTFVLSSERCRCSIRYGFRGVPDLVAHRAVACSFISELLRLDRSDDLHVLHGGEQSDHGKHGRYPFQRGRRDRDQRKKVQPQRQRNRNVDPLAESAGKRICLKKF